MVAHGPLSQDGRCHGAKSLLCYVEHLRRLSPTCRIGLHGTALSARMVGFDKILGLRAQRKIYDDDIGVFLEEKAGEFKVYYFILFSLYETKKVGKLMTIPEPAPVIMPFCSLSCPSSQLGDGVA
jgi:hypothetical protein